MGNVILGLLLLHGPLTIYDLHKQAAQGVSLFYRASLGSLRGALNAQLERGEIEFEETVERGRRKKIYRPTAAGIAVFHAWMSAPITGSNTETVAMSKLFFLGLVEDVSDRRVVLDGILTRVRSDALELESLAAYLDGLEIPADVEPVFAYQRSVLAYGIGAHRFALDHFAAVRERE